jgi:uncharacterized membrane protein YccC
MRIWHRQPDQLPLAEKLDELPSADLRKAGDRTRLPLRWGLILAIGLAIGLATGLSGGLAAGLVAGVVTAAAVHAMLE